MREKEGARKFLKREKEELSHEENDAMKTAKRARLKFLQIFSTRRERKVESRKSKTSGEKHTTEGALLFLIIHHSASAFILYKRGKTFFRDLAYTRTRARTRETETETEK